MSMWIAVAVGGAIGAPLRYLLDRQITTRVAGTAGWSLFPWGLFIVNVLGSALAGIALALPAGTMRTLLIVGICGAFTTFSGYAWELHRLWSLARPVFWAALVALPIATVAVALACWRMAVALTG